MRESEKGIKRKRVKDRERYREKEGKRKWVREVNREWVKEREMHKNMVDIGIYIGYDQIWILWPSKVCVGYLKLFRVH
jgi:hypothetical protein